MSLPQKLSPAVLSSQLGCFIIHLCMYDALFQSFSACDEHVTFVMYFLHADASECLIYTICILFLN